MTTIIKGSEVVGMVEVIVWFEAVACHRMIS